MNAAFMTAVAAAVLGGGGPPAAPRGGVVESEGTIVLSDGTELAHTLLHPDGEGPWPVLLTRTCYGRRLGADEARPFVEHGLALVIQDVRGTGKSKGEWTPFLNEPQDGAQTFDWIVAQPWCNGKVGTRGASYLGITQWQLAPHAGGRLAAMAAHFSSADVPRDVVHFGGVQGLAIPLAWSEATSGNRAAPRFKALPLIDADDASGKDLAVWNDWCRHPILDDYWKELDFAPRYADVKAPLFLVAGWYDLLLPGQINDYVRLSKRAGPPEQSFARLVVGPWDHGGFKELPGRPDLGPDAWRSPLDEERAFLAHFLLGEQNGFEAKAGVRAFFLGENRWRELDGWPPKSARATDLFLRSLGGAGEKPGNGTLIESRAPVRAEPADSFTYDPSDPCPSYATSLWTPLSTLADQAEIARRTDVLVYRTPPLPADVSVAGPITLELWITSDAPDTDFAAKLVDVAPDGANGPDGPDGTGESSGAVEWRGEGIQRARVRDGVREERLLEPGVPTRLVVRMGHVAATFLAGHRIGLHVTSSNFPRFSRNLNTAERSNVAAEPRVAHQQVLHDPDHPSRLILWTLPSGE